jgi:hypothetical protein
MRPAAGRREDSGGGRTAGGQRQESDDGRATEGRRREAVKGFFLMMFPQLCNLALHVFSYYRIVSVNGRGLIGGVHDMPRQQIRGYVYSGDLQ